MGDTDHEKRRQRAVFIVRSAESRNGGADIPGAAEDGARIAALVKAQIVARQTAPIDNLQNRLEKLEKDFKVISDIVTDAIGGHMSAALALREIRKVIGSEEIHPYS